MATPPTGAPARLTPRDVSTRAVRVPLTFALGTSAAIVRAVPLLLVDLGTEEGLIGRTYLFCYTPSGARAIAELSGRRWSSCWANQRRRSILPSSCSGASHSSA